uniref:Mediator of RNA polymerase II transcription subunit 19 n=1 Tax=Rhabditophanes sp. KR3021 TaxID=114890 RepID=A0AC35TIK2_9BILA
MEVTEDEVQRTSSNILPEGNAKAVAVEKLMTLLNSREAIQAQKELMAEQKKQALAEENARKLKDGTSRIDAFIGLSRDVPVTQHLLGSFDILDIYNLRGEYQKMAGDNKLSTDLMSFVPFVGGKLSNPTYNRVSGMLRELYERPPICDKEIISFSPSMLNGFKLQPVKLDPKYCMEGNVMEIISDSIRDEGNASQCEDLDETKDGDKSLWLSSTGGDKSRKRQRTKEEKELRKKQKLERKETKKLRKEIHHEATSG